MTRLFYKGATMEAEELEALEVRLQAAFSPVPMRTGFSQALKQRLHKENELELEKPRAGLRQSVFLTAAWLLSGVLLVALGIRGLIALVNSLAGLQQVKNELASKKAAPAQTAM